MLPAIKLLLKKMIGLEELKKALPEGTLKLTDSKLSTDEGENDTGRSLSLPHFLLCQLQEFSENGNQYRSRIGTFRVSEVIGIERQK